MYWTRLAGNAGRKKSPENRRLGTIVVGLYLRNEGTYRQSKKNLLSSNMSSTFPPQYGELRPLAAQIGLPVWGTPANFNGFRVLAALLHGSKLVSVSQTLRSWTQGATITLGIGPHF